MREHFFVKKKQSDSVKFYFWWEKICMKKGSLILLKRMIWKLITFPSFLKGISWDLSFCLLLDFLFVFGVFLITVAKEFKGTKIQFSTFLTFIYAFPTPFFSRGRWKKRNFFSVLIPLFQVSSFSYSFFSVFNMERLLKGKKKSLFGRVQQKPLAIFGWNHKYHHIANVSFFFTHCKSVCESAILSAALH